MKQALPTWMRDWLDVIVPVGEVVLVLLGAWLLQRLMRSLIVRLGTTRGLPREMATVMRRVSATLISFGAVLLVLDRLGVSGTVLWTAFTGFAAVGAVAFFAAWSVLSNIFCAVLIFSTRLFRLSDYVEVLENGEKPGLKGRVVDINLIYSTLQEVGPDARDTGSVLQVPNSMFFQRTVRRWRGTTVPTRWLDTPAANAAPQESR
ncbi:mechanosensitive ion channel family protein [Pseudoxanthomonas suwonensis]|uniref:mechanosensitive ion channel family protein n=1 Tax=Pseudoxanthomonas suwonensis TaxID=314722 RepID=UPI000465AA6D|nr:mechanosensitive ion channel family protein [Pseudoxanthomonas suwonensis]